MKKLNVGYRHLRRIEISEGSFADDVIILTEKESDLQTNLEIWNTVLREYGMKLNKNKTKVMIISKERERKEINIKIDNVNIEQVNHFKYLGIQIEDNGGQDMEINNRIEKALKVYHLMNKNFINRKEISQKTKTSVFKTIYRPILTFGCESWVLTKAQKSKIQATEMKFLRRIKGVTRLDKIRNQKIREDLEVKPTLAYIENRQLSWWGHLQRMNSGRPVKQVWEAKPQRNKQRGRPRQTWDKAVGEIMQKRGKTWTEARILA